MFKFEKRFEQRGSMTKLIKFMESHLLIISVIRIKEII